MLVLRRHEGQWVELTHRSGDQIWIRVYNLRRGYPGQLDMAFDDPDSCFNVQRGERPRRLKTPASGHPLMSSAADWLLETT
jgi:hypothetical protein